MMVAVLFAPAPSFATFRFVRPTVGRGYNVVLTEWNRDTIDLMRFTAELTSEI